MKRLFGYQAYWYAGATLTLGLLGWVGVRAGDSPSECWAHARGHSARSRGHHLHRAKPAGPGACRLRECRGHATPKGFTQLSCPGAG
jgi:hypothetical protein